MYNYERKEVFIIKYKLKHSKKKRRLRPWAFWFFLILFLTIILISSFKIYNWQKDNNKIKNIDKNIKKDIKVKENNNDGELVNQPKEKESDYWYYVKLPFYEVDFNSLVEKNNDTVAFIHMKNTNINYPVVQTNNNDYYLTHAFDKSKNSAGWVFMDYRNNISNLNDNTVIYGHGRIDKTVFGSLKNSLNKSWQANKENLAIWLSTKNQNLLFQIFSIYTIKSENYYITTNFENTEKKQTWLNTMKERNIAAIDNSVNINDKILTLSTCKNNSGDRIVVQAKLIKRQIK